MLTATQRASILAGTAVDSMCIDRGGERPDDSFKALKKWFQVGATVSRGLAAATHEFRCLSLSFYAVAVVAVAVGIVGLPVLSY